MLHLLNPAVDLLIRNIEKGVPFRTMHITYSPPEVHRLIFDLPELECRAFLHRIAPCAAEEALYHPHPWPSAMLILSSLGARYIMRVGHGQGSEPPPVTMTLDLADSSRYEMTHIDGWHSVQPVGAPVWTLMLTKAPWGRSFVPKPETLQKPIDVEQAQMLLQSFHIRLTAEVGARR